jgi:tetratricopeptide (TPR) repeat protein
VSQTSRAKAPPVSTSVSGGGVNTGTALEASVRQLIANGKFKAALENAKEFHKAQHTAVSESLLLDAYVARIQSLVDQNLTLEAKSLLDLVRERFPRQRERLDHSLAVVSARGGDLAGLLQPLNNPDLSLERRAAIELIIQTQVTDLAALAGCAALPPEHSLRRSAAALDLAFNQVTSGPVTEEQIALPEVPYRSPLAPWKVLIRAIACLHRGRDETCREHLAAIKPGSVPARLVPVIQSILGVNPAAPLKPAEIALVLRITADLSQLHASLLDLDRAFEDGGDEARTFKAVRAVVRDCQTSAPERLDGLKQIICVRGMVAGLDERRLVESLGGSTRKDAAFLRMGALAFESSGEEPDLFEACDLWEKFRQQALKEGWFRSNGVEAAILYLHMASLLDRVSEQARDAFVRYFRSGKQQAAVDDFYFLFPDKLYTRACVIDPHPEAFSQWLRWAVVHSPTQAQDVAREWNRLCPRDIEPLRYLMQEAEKSGAFPTALSWLEKAERIDAVHPQVRAARLRLLAAAAMNHLQKKKPDLATENLTSMAALPQSQQGDRPAFLATLRYLINKVGGDESGATQARLEAVRLLGSELTAALLAIGLAAILKRQDLVSLPVPKVLVKPERKATPATLARVLALIKDVGIANFQLPVTYLQEAEKQFPGTSSSLDVEQILLLGEIGVATDQVKLAWAASGEGLKRGGLSEARFLLLRASALPARHAGRYLALAAAAAALARFHRDLPVIDKAVDMARNTHPGDSFSLTVEGAREVVRRELKSPAFPQNKPGVNYSDLLPLRQELCQCPDCRRARGEVDDFWDDDDEFFEDEEFEPANNEAETERLFNQSVPKEIPPALARQLFEMLKESYLTGGSSDEIVGRVLGGTGAGGGKKKKGRRK